MPEEIGGKFAQLKTAFPEVKFFANEPLSKHTYFKVGGPADLYADISQLDLFFKVTSFCKQKGIPLTILGGGSNVLVRDEGIRGLVIKNMCEGLVITGSLVHVESGMPMNVLVRKTIDQGLQGLEYFMGLPGTVGGAVINNSHYKKQLFGDFITSVEVIDESGNKKTYTKDELKFQYDYSLLQDTKDIVLSVELELKPGDVKSLQEIALQATQYRAETQPIGQPSSGCMFKNVAIPEELRSQFDGKEKVSAGWLIDKAGLKGLRVGDAVVSDKHANFIVNTGAASAKDIQELSDLVAQRVFEKFDLKLQCEVFVV